MTSKKKTSPSSEMTPRQLYESTQMGFKSYMIAAFLSAQREGMTPMQMWKEFQAFCMQRTVQELEGTVNNDKE